MQRSIEQHEPRPDKAGSLGELLQVAVPLVISYSASAMMYVVDRIFLSWYSVEALAAALPASVLQYNLVALGLGTVGYCNAVVAQYYGARQDEKIGPVLWQGIYVSLVAAALVVATIPFAPAVFSLFGHDPQIQALELRYFSITCWGAAPLLIHTTLACFYSGRGQTKIIMVANIIGTLVNIVLDYLLIFGKAGFPRLGVDGAALATVTAFAAIALIYVVAIAMSPERNRFRVFAGWRFDRALCARLLRFGLPSGFYMFLDVACWTLFVQLIGGLGTHELAATGLVFNLNTLVFVPLLGMGTAVMSLVGRRVGECRPRLAVRTTWLAFAVACAYIALPCAVYVFAPGLIVRPYGLGGDRQLEQTVILLLRFVAVYSLFDAMAVIFSSAVRGAGDTRFAMIFSLCAGMSVLVLPTWLATSRGPEGFLTAWYSVTVFIVVLGVGFCLRFVQGRWQRMRVIEQTAVERDDDASAPREAHDSVAASL